MPPIEPDSSTESSNAAEEEIVCRLREIGLAYVTDGMPGFRRVKRGTGFSYLGPKGRVIRDESTLERIRLLVIPPAYEHVWICRLANGHLQATGRDQAGRKQYRYHPAWIEFRSQAKYVGLQEFGRALPKLRKQIDADLGRPALDQRHVLAAIARLLDLTLIRIGNKEYARQNDSYGLTTLLDDHVKVNGSEVKFFFRGKSGVEHEIELENPRLARVIRQCRNLPGDELFQYKDADGNRQKIDSCQVNDYLREITGLEITAKNFRTWGGTVLAAIDLAGRGPAETEREANRQITAAIKEVAKKLGNRPAVCRKYYVHPAVLDAYREGWLFEIIKNPPPEDERTVPLRDLSKEEKAVMEILRQAEAREMQVS